MLSFWQAEPEPNDLQESMTENLLNTSGLAHKIPRTFKQHSVVSELHLSMGASTVRTNVKAPEILPLLLKRHHTEDLDRTDP